MWKAQLYLEEIPGEEDIEVLCFCAGLTRTFKSKMSWCGIRVNSIIFIFILMLARR